MHGLPFTFDVWLLNENKGDSPVQWQGRVFGTLVCAHEMLQNEQR